MAKPRKIVLNDRSQAEKGYIWYDYMYVCNVQTRQIHGQKADEYLLEGGRGTW